MKLADLLQRLTKRSDARAVERAENESRLTQREREVDREDFEGRKDDLAARSTWAGSEAEGAAGEDLE